MNANLTNLSFKRCINQLKGVGVSPINGEKVKGERGSEEVGEEEQGREHT